MLQIVVKNLSSQLDVRHLIEQKMEHIIGKFPDLCNHRIMVTLAAKSASSTLGPQLFSGIVQIRGKKYHSIVIEKQADNLFLLLSALMESLPRKIDRFGDKVRVKERNNGRRYGLHQRDFFAPVQQEHETSEKAGQMG